MKIDDLLNFMPYVQAMMLVNAGFMYVSETSRFIQFQTGFYEWFRGFNIFKRIRMWTLKKYRPVRRDSPVYLLERKLLLADLYTSYKATMNWEKTSDHFIPIGFCSALYCLLFMILVPIGKSSEEAAVCENIFIYFVAVFLLVEAIFLYCSYRGSIQNRTVYIVLPGLFISVGVLCIWWLIANGIYVSRFLSFELALYLSLAIPIMPILAYLVQILFSCFYRLWMLYKMTVNIWALEYLKWRRHH